MTSRAGGGFLAIRYTFKTALAVGPLRLWRAMRSKNACKTCALGMGGQQGGMRNELGHFPEVCKKSLQAMAGDLRPALPPDFFQKNTVPSLRAWSPRDLEAAGRLTSPILISGSAQSARPISWNEALSMIVERLRARKPAETFFYASGRSSNEAGFLLQLFARVYGTNNVNNCSYYCHQASGVGLSDAIGSGTATIDLADLEKSDLFFLIGGNPASNHPRLMTILTRLRRRGGKVVVINPAREPGLVRFKVPSDWRSMIGRGHVATHYVQPHAGGDIAFLLGVAKVLHEMGAWDLGFLERHTEGAAEFENQIRQLTFLELAQASGVGEPIMRQIADVYRQSQRTVFGWTMGITHHLHGVDNVRTIVNLALLRGMVGKPGAGLLPIRGHSNVQGIGTVGVVPVLKPAILKAMTENLGITMPPETGLDTMACMEAAAAGRLKIGIALGGNLFGSNPDATFAERALASLDLMVYISTALNTGHVRGLGQNTLILPACARDEEGRTTQESMFNFVRLSDGGRARHQGPQSEIAILSKIAGAVVGDQPVPFSRLGDGRGLRSFIAQAIPDMAAIGGLDTTGREFTIPGRLLHEPRFKTASGRAKMTVCPVPNPSKDIGGNVFRLMTIRSEGQFNTVVYEENDLYRGQTRRDVILLNPNDMDDLGLRRGQKVTVAGPAGRMSDILVQPFNVRRGNAMMYYPEVNQIVPRAVDRESKTPAFKSVLVKVLAGL